MLPVLTAEEMRQADRHTIETIGLPGAVLMENAGAAVARILRERFPSARRIAVICGRGNNGGDGFVVGRRLREIEPLVVLVGRRDEVQGDAQLHLEACERSGVRVTPAADAAGWAAVADRVRAADVVVDALLGTGLRSEPRGLVAEVIAELARLGEAGRPVVAVDLPSGLPSDSGEVRWPTVRATLTVAFAVPKRGHVLPPARERVGELVVADIGITPETIALVQPALFLLESQDAAAAFPARAPGSHKGDYGHLLVVAGSIGKTGAATLAALGALRSGVGLVTVATAAPALPIVASSRPEFMTEPLPATVDGAVAAEALERLLALARERDAVLIGPGLGQEPSTRQLVRAFVSRCPVPLALDADALNALAPSGGEAVALELVGGHAPAVLTPHPGEAGRLLGRPVPEVQRARVDTAIELAGVAQAVVALKGEATVVADPSGRAVVNPTGNAGLATGGTGDVLAGIVGSLLARHEAWLASVAAVYVHGLAGDLAASRLGQESLVAGDVVESLPAAIAAIARAGGGSSAS